MGQYYADGQSSINVTEWQKIVAYYKYTAPVKLVIPKPEIAPLKDWAIFDVIRPVVKDTSGLPAMTTFTGYNAADHKIYSGDATGSLFTWSSKLNPKLVKKMPSPVTGALFSTNGSHTAIFTCIGILPPSDIAKGKVVQFNLDNKAKDTLTIGDGLPRAVQTVAEDFNKDGLTDYVVAVLVMKKGACIFYSSSPVINLKNQSSGRCRAVSR